MFNIGFPELIVVLLVAFLVVGPKDLPKVARWLGRQVKAIRRMIADVKEETGWDDLEQDIDKVKSEAAQAGKELDVTSDIRDASQELQRNVNGIKKDVRKMDQEARDARKK